MYRPRIEVKYYINENVGDSNMRPLSLKELRRRKGMTISDLSAQSQIDVGRLEGLEEGRRRLTPEEAEKLSVALGYKPQVLLEDNKRYAVSDDVLEKFGSYAQIPYISFRHQEVIVNAINDFVHWIARNDLQLSDDTTERDIFHRWLISQTRERLTGSLDDYLSFVMSVPINHYVASVWITVYIPPHVEKITVVFEAMNGSIISNAEKYIDEFLRQWADVLTEPTKGRGHSYDNFRFIDLAYHYGRAEYTEIEMVNERARFRTVQFAPPVIPKKSYRYYRTAVSSEELAQPFEPGDGDDRCDHSTKSGVCPHISREIPSLTGGCLNCRRIQLTWQAREWLMNHFTDDELVLFEGVFDLEQSYPKIYEDFHREFSVRCDSLRDTCDDLFNRVREWSGTSVIALNQNGSYSDGHHRVSIAKIMGAKSVPVQFDTTDRKNGCYLIRG